MSVSRLLNSIGGVTVAVGIGTIAFAHIVVAPELQRSVDVARQAVDDGGATLVLLSETVEATEALRPPTEEVTRSSDAHLPGAAPSPRGKARGPRSTPCSWRDTADRPHAVVVAVARGAAAASGSTANCGTRM